MKGDNGMDFTITEEQDEIRQAILTLCGKRLNHHVHEDDETSVFPSEKWKACGEFGLPGLPIPEEYGGIGLDMLSTAMAIRAFGYGCHDEGLVFSLCAHMLTCVVPVFRFGTEEQKRRFLPKLCSGEYIGGNGITEAEAGSDVSSMRTTVKKTAGGYRLEGTKIFVTNGPVANLLVIYAKHPQGMKMLDVSAFIVGTDNPGLRVGQVFKKMGLRTAPLSEIVLDECAVDENGLLGRERMGMEIFNDSMMWERVIMAAYHIGSMEQQYELTAGYASMRKQFGRSIIGFESVADRLVDMKMRIETARLLLYRVCWDYDRGKADLPDAAMVKLYASESKVANSMSASHIFGAYGYMKESRVEKQLRDSIAATVYSGTSEIQRRIISEKIRSEYA
ncbi:MAG: acyl-CoA/acyl-ACP dehydrogenase [Spirochaetales bacterium]|nr:acyl-CoA/acyl-ACP dehydrogenase [Spirochaetales bacterium]